MQLIIMGSIAAHFVALISVATNLLFFDEENKIV